jgi:hypothetical protein
METNWDLIKFQYEVLGESLEDLAAVHEVSPAVLKFNAESWKPIPLAQQKALQFPDLSSLEEITKEMAKQVREHARTASLLKQKFLGPKYIALEAMLLTQATTILSNIDPKDPRSANSVKTITSVLKELLEQNSILHVSSEKEDFEAGTGPTKWEISFVTPEGEHAEESTEEDGAEEDD